MSALAEAFRVQARACEDLGSPFMGQLCRVLGENLRPGTALTDRLFGWPGALGPRHESVPLRLCGALHALKRAGCAVLGPVYPPQHADDAQLWAAVEEAMTIHEPQIMAFIDSPPQTNELRRSVALIAAGHWLTQHHDLPMLSFELGASGGLNLHWHRYGLQTPMGLLGAADPVLTLRPAWRGPVPRGPRPRVATSTGVDLNPLDPTRPEDAQRLLAYLWPDQPDRLALTRAAIADMTPAQVARGDAIDWLAPRLAPVPGHLRLICHTVAWQYFPPQKQAEGTALIEAAGAEASAESPLAWVAMENDGDNHGAALTVRLWPDAPGPRLLARLSFHGQWIDWQG